MCRMYVLRNDVGGSRLPRVGSRLGKHNLSSFSSEKATLEKILRSEVRSKNYCDVGESVERR